MPESEDIIVHQIAKTLVKSVIILALSASQQQGQSRAWKLRLVKRSEMF